MNIIYGILPYKYLEQLGGINFLAGFSYDSKAILDIKFIAELKSGILFSALAVNNDNYQYPKFNGLINSIITTKPKMKSIRKLTYQQEMQLSERARKKRSRKEKNLFLTSKNWKQFIGKRKSIINLYNSVSNSSISL